MEKIYLDVYRMNNPDGTPRKYWACGSYNGDFITRWGAANASLQEKRKLFTSNIQLDAGKEKEAKGYVFCGEFLVSNEIHWDQRKGDPAPKKIVAPKFSGPQLAWIADTLPTGWQLLVRSVLSDIDNLLLTDKGGDLEIKVQANQIVLKSKISSGVVMPDDFRTALVILRLAKFLPIDMTDSESKLVTHRHELKKLLTDLGCKFKQKNEHDEFDEFALNIGLIPKLDTTMVVANPVLAHFF